MLIVKWPIDYRVSLRFSEPQDESSEWGRSAQRLAKGKERDMKRDHYNRKLQDY